MMWPVVPLCEAQLQDVNPKDILEHGLFRRCNTYKGGGGYDKFPAIYNQRTGANRTDLHDQFVVQLKGCPLKCPYCYVTQDGIHGDCVKVATDRLVQSYRDSGCSVFHLMGGAPALYINQWPELIEKLDGEVFHSDLLCVESEYDRGVLRELAKAKNTLYAISIKGSSPEEFKKNTGVDFPAQLFERNLRALFEEGVPCYFTFTGMNEESVAFFKWAYPGYPYEDAFAIQLVHYKALDYKSEQEG